MFDPRVEHSLFETGVIDHLVAVAVEDYVGGFQSVDVVEEVAVDVRRGGADA